MGVANNYLRQQIIIIWHKKVKILILFSKVSYGDKNRFLQTLIPQYMQTLRLR